MTNSILERKVVSLSVKSKKHNRNAFKALIGLVIRSKQRLEHRKLQLAQIANEHFDVFVRIQAEEHLAKQMKLIRIADELISKIKSALKISSHQQMTQHELIQQYFEELDILNFMEFEVAKKYFSFIHDYYQPKVIPINSVAA
ncbi:MAG: hypothetical protein AAF573_20120 [Bacteroidota bacterium]